MKWYLISDESVEAIREALTLTDGQIRELDAMHQLDSGLHETDAVPTDYQLQPDLDIAIMYSNVPTITFTLDNGTELIYELRTSTEPDKE